MAHHSLYEFLYVDPDTGMVLCMIADGDGFRPAHAAEELESVDLALIHRDLSGKPNSPVLPSGRQAEFDALDEFNGLYAYAVGYERTYGDFSAPMA